MINTRIPLILLRPSNETNQPMQDAGKKAAQLMSIARLSVEEVIHFRFLDLLGGMALVDRGLSNSRHSATRTVKNQPDDSFRRPCE